MKTNQLPRHIRWDQKIQQFPNSKASVIFSLVNNLMFLSVLVFTIYTNLNIDNPNKNWKYGLLTLSIFWMFSLKNLVTSYRNWKRATSGTGNVG